MPSGTPRTFIGSTTFEEGQDLRALPARGHREIATVDGVGSVTVDLATGTVTASRPVDRADISAVVDEAGHILVP